MKHKNCTDFGQLSHLASLLLIFATVGCETSGITTLKSRGVYTVLAPSEPSLNLPATGYLPRNKFNLGETPAAIIVGYGEYNRPQLVALDVIELRTGHSVFGHDYYASYGKVVVQPLPMRISGSYRVRLIVNDSEYDSCEFTVGSEIVPTSEYNPPTNYAQGLFSVAVGTSGTEEVALQIDGSKQIFAKYDDRLTYDILAAVTKEASETKPSPFTQRVPGMIVIQCYLDASGSITKTTLLENTIGEECSQVFLKALLKRSPYSPWPEDVRNKFDSNSRNLNIIIRFE